MRTTAANSSRERVIVADVRWEKKICWLKSIEFWIKFLRKREYSQFENELPLIFGHTDK